MTKFLNISTDNTLGGNTPSDVLVASQKAIKEYVDSQSSGGSVDIDNNTITKNTSDEIQAVAVIDQNTGVAKTWTGTMAEYDAIVPKDPETEYIITDDIGGPATEIGEITEALNDKVDKGHQVIEFQAPTSANGYTWYRKYADGWVEQGGEITSGTINDTVNLLVEMADTHYFTTVHLVSSQAYSSSTGTANVNGCNTLIGTINRRGTTSFYISYPTDSDGRSYMWEVKGMAA